MPHSAKKFLFSLFLTTSYFLLAPNSYAQSPWTGDCVYDGDVATIQGLECLVGNILNVAITIIGMVVILMLVFGAYKLLTSGGNAQSVESGKQTITYAILGLTLAVASWFILNLIATFTGNSSIPQFDIPNSS